MVNGVQGLYPLYQTRPGTNEPIRVQNPSFAKSSLKVTPKEGLCRRFINWILSFCCRKKPQASPQIAQTPQRKQCQPVAEVKPTTPLIKRDFNISSIDDLYFAFMKAKGYNGDESYLEPMLRFIQSNDLDLSPNSREIVQWIINCNKRPAWEPLFDAFIGRPRQKELLNAALSMALICIKSKEESSIVVAEKLIAAGADDTQSYDGGIKSAAEQIKWWKAFFQT